MINMISSQLFKVRKSLIWPVVTISYIVLTFVGFIDQLLAKEVPDSLYEHFLTHDYIFIIVGILAALLLSIDYTSGSIKQIIGKGTSRIKYAIANCIVVSAAALIMMLVNYCVLYAFYSPVYGSKALGIGSVQELEIIIALTATVCFMYTAFTMIIAFLSGKTSVTLITSMLMATVLMNIVPPGKGAIDPIHLLRSSTVFNDWRITVGIMLIEGVLLLIASIVVLNKKEL